MFSFDTRKRLVAIRGFVRQLMDTTSPNRPPLEGEFRAENRSSRALPILLAPWENLQPIVDESTYAVTKDFSDHGLSLVLHQPFKSDQVVVVLWLEHAYFGLGEVRQNVPLGGGFWQVGIELTDVVNTGEYPQLESLLPMAARLVPQSATHAV